MLQGVVRRGVAWRGAVSTLGGGTPSSESRPDLYPIHAYVYKVYLCPFVNIDQQKQTRHASLNT